MDELRPVITAKEVQRYHDLGLGRGVNVTDPHMWKNKSHFLIRKVTFKGASYSYEGRANVIGTEESGMKQKYEEEVSTVAKQQAKIRLSLDEPSSQVKIGMDAQYSQSTTSTKLISGTKIKTRTISFQVNFNDLPVSTFVDHPDSETSTSEYDECFDESFESSLYSWILKRVRDRQGSEEPQVQTLTQYLHELQILPPESRERRQKELNEIVKDCKMFIKDMGITHYVSSIELGALKYSVYTIRSRHTRLGGGAQIGAAHLAEGGASSLAEKLRFKTSREQREIGKFSDDGTVIRNTTDEAVIGFQIQPIHNLVRSQYIQVALQKAVHSYIEFKADKTGKLHEIKKHEALI